MIGKNITEFSHDEKHYRVFHRFCETGYKLKIQNEFFNKMILVSIILFLIVFSVDKFNFLGLWVLIIPSFSWSYYFTNTRYLKNTLINQILDMLEYFEKDIEIGNSIPSLDHQPIMLYEFLTISGFLENYEKSIYSIEENKEWKQLWKSEINAIISRYPMIKWGESIKDKFFVIIHYILHFGWIYFFVKEFLI